MEMLITVTNGLSVLAFIAFLGFIFLLKKEGSDERTQYMGYKLVRFLFTFLLVGLGLIIFITSWKTLNYTSLRVCITTLFSLNVLIGFGYWIYLSKTT